MKNPIIRILSLAVLAVAPLSVHAGPADTPRFADCIGNHRVTCVVDGDTFWLDGTKIRIADINAPETSHPSCPYEAQLGAQATRRLTELLNAGAFTLTTEGRATDRYGRALRVVMRGRQSLGRALVDAGLAEAWTGHRRNWCGAG
ncbi:thermonuclease family protein [Novosphingobium sp.]|uniref:thermonuclease family protein n=1 Tax=Novosphingobium sp. TaxID=1874826 RepID=UPI0038BBC1D1